MKQILVFSGTTEGNAVAEMLSRYPVRVYLSVATEYGRVCAGKYENVEVITGRKDREEIKAFLRGRQISLVIDATHPFARIVTENLKAACEECKVEYIRCLRDAIEEGDKTEGREAIESIGATEERCTDRETASVVEVDSVREAVRFLKGTEGKILITTGSKELKEYTEIPDYRNRCYARVLPAGEAVSESCALGFEGKHLIAMQGPFSKEMNVALLHHIGACYFVTKESGKAGGFPEKLQAAEETGTVLVVIGRPKEAGMTLTEVQAYLERICGSESDFMNGF